MLAVIFIYVRGSGYLLGADCALRLLWAHGGVKLVYKTYSGGTNELGVDCDRFEADRLDPVHALEHNRAWGRT